MTPDQIDTTLQTIAEGFRTWPRAPLLHWPDEAGLAYEDVFFPSEDGVPLEGWFVPCAGSDRIVIANHPRWFNRAGLPSHLHPWKQFGGATGKRGLLRFRRAAPAKRPSGREIRAFLRRSVRQLRANWPRVEVPIRAESDCCEHTVLR